MASTAAQIPTAAAAPQNVKPAQIQQIIVPSPRAGALVSRLKLKLLARLNAIVGPAVKGEVALDLLVMRTPVPGVIVVCSH